MQGGPAPCPHAPGPSCHLCAAQLQSARTALPAHALPELSRPVKLCSTCGTASTCAAHGEGEVLLQLGATCLQGGAGAACSNVGRICCRGYRAVVVRQGNENGPQPGALLIPVCLHMSLLEWAGQVHRSDRRLQQHECQSWQPQAVSWRAAHLAERANNRSLVLTSFLGIAVCQGQHSAAVPVDGVRQSAVSQPIQGKVYAAGIL